MFVLKSHEIGVVTDLNRSQVRTIHTHDELALMDHQSHAIQTMLSVKSRTRPISENRGIDHHEHDRLGLRHRHADFDRDRSDLPCR